MNELLSGFAPSQIEWIRVNAPLVRSTLTRMAHSSAETQKRREERRVKLLTRHKHLSIREPKVFVFSPIFRRRTKLRTTP